jgi:hypothetical protein
MRPDQAAGEAATRPISHRIESSSDRKSATTTLYVAVSRRNAVAESGESLPEVQAIIESRRRPHVQLRGRRGQDNEHAMTACGVYGPFRWLP